MVIDADHLRDKTQVAHLLVVPTRGVAAPQYKFNFSEVMTYVMKPTNGVFPVILVSTCKGSRSFIPCEWSFLPMPCTSAVQAVWSRLKINVSRGQPSTSSDTRALRSSPMRTAEPEQSPRQSPRLTSPLRRSPLRQAAGAAESPPRGREQERRRSQRHGASAVDRYTTNPVPLSAFEALGVVLECRHEHHYLVHPMLRSMK